MKDFFPYNFLQMILALYGYVHGTRDTCSSQPRVRSKSASAIGFGPWFCRRPVPTVIINNRGTKITKDVGRAPVLLCTYSSTHYIQGYQYRCIVYVHMYTVHCMFKPLLKFNLTCSRRAFFNYRYVSSLAAQRSPPNTAQEFKYLLLHSSFYYS